MATGDSMLPTIARGSYLLVTATGAVRDGAVVVVERDDREIVKRVARANGDSITVVGDNPTRSTDSRSFGPVPTSAIRGVVRAVYWPPSAWRLL